MKRRSVLISSVLAGVVLLGVGLGLNRSQAQAAPIKVAFWHYLSPETGSDVIAQLAAEFNKSQNKVEIQPVEVGAFQDVQLKTVAALRSGGLPGMAMVDNGFFLRLAFEGRLANVTDLVNAMPKTTVQDFYPVAWEFGDFKGQRLGLPFAASALMLYYNADAFKAKGINPPRTLEEFAQTAKALTGRATKGAVFITDAWTYGSLVMGRGGHLVEANKPDFDSPGALETLSILYNMSKAGTMTVRSFSELNFAFVDFLRTKAMMIIGPSTGYKISTRYSFAFKMATVPLPGKTIAGEAQYVIFKQDNPDVRKGAFDFWQYLTKPENIAKFTKDSAYLPVRKSAVKLLGDFPLLNVVKDGLGALERSENIPQLVEFLDWRRALEDQLERSLKGGVDPKSALAEAQRQALK